MIRAGSVQPLLPDRSHSRDRSDSSGPNCPASAMRNRSKMPRIPTHYSFVPSSLGLRCLTSAWDGASAMSSELVAEASRQDDTLRDSHEKINQVVVDRIEKKKSAYLIYRQPRHDPACSCETHPPSKAHMHHRALRAYQLCSCPAGHPIQPSPAAAHHASIAGVGPPTAKP